MTEPRKRATIKDVAREAGVSFSLASQVLRNDPGATRRETTRARIFEAAKNLDYQYHAGARSMRTGKSGIVGVISPTTPIIMTAVESEQIIVDELNRRGYRVAVMGVSDHGGEHSDNAFEEMLSLRVEGVVINRVLTFHYGSQIAMLQRNGIPVVAIGSGEGEDFDGLREDEYQGFFDSTSHLIRIGHRRIMFMGYMRGEYVGFPPRLEGYKDAMAAAGLPVTEQLVVEMEKFEGRHGSEIGFNAAKWVVQNGSRPDAIICSNDEVTFGAMRAIHESGLRVPQDIALVGYDDIALAAYGAVSLTTVAQPKNELAAGAVDILCRRISGEIDSPEPLFRMIKPQLVVRESCGVNLKTKKQGQAG